MQTELKTMRQVVEWLHSCNAEARLELLEFGFALQEMVRFLEVLNISLRDLHADIATAAITEESRNGLEALLAFEQRSELVSVTCEQIVIALTQVSSAVRTWNGPYEAL